MEFQLSITNWLNTQFAYVDKILDKKKKTAAYNKIAWEPVLKRKYNLTCFYIVERNYVRICLRGATIP